MSDRRALVASVPRELRIAFGVLTLVLGLVALIWPTATLLVVAVLFGLQLVIAGLVRVVVVVARTDAPGRWRRISGILGLLTFVAGVVFLFRPSTSLVVLAIILAIGWIIDGVSELVSAFAVPRRATERAALIAFGVLSIIAAFIVLALPHDSLVLLARTGGVILIAFGVVGLIAALAGRTRSVGVGAETA